MRFFRFFLLLSLAASWSAFAAPRNVVLMVIDDLGATDLGCYGSRYYETPNIDKLAADSVKFTQAYSACTVCSPTRAALLTGKYPARLHITDWIAGHDRPFAKLKPPAWTLQLPLEEITLAELFHGAGRATAHIGKWHLGEEAFYPDKQGFDLNLGGTHRGQPPSYFSPYKIPTLPDGPEGEFLTDRECTEACKFIEANRQRPFFLYLPHHAVHTPLMGKKDVVAKYQDKSKSGHGQGKPVYAALVESVDDSVGRLRAKLEELNLWQETVFIFTSDNGGLALGQTTTNLGMRAGKGSAYEGGVRIPLLIHAPGVAKSAAACATPVISPDLLPTLLDVCEVKAQKSANLDGESLAPLLRAEGNLKREAIFWHYPHYHPGGATPYSAVRRGDWKLLHFYEDDRMELYHLAADPEEKQDLSGKELARVKELRSLLDQWLIDTAAQAPVPNPHWDPAKDGGKKGAAAKKVPSN